MTGTLAGVRELLYERFAAAWTPGTSTYCFDNEKFDPPQGATWARVSMRHVESTQESLGTPGNRRWERKALLFVQLFAPLNSGVKDLDDKAQIVRTTFEGARVQSAGEDIRCFAVAVNEVGPTDAWFQYNVQANVTYYETR